MKRIVLSVVGAALAVASAALLFGTTPPSPSAPSERDTALTAAAKDAAVIKAGKETYAGLCKSCHGEESVQGDSPSNLFDGKWFRAKAPAEIEAVVMQGVLDKGMPAWGEVLPPEDTLAVTAYLLSAQKTPPSS